ncbi:hypothetical protein V9T40_006759 [Parthenolecanium corni]|uniref:Major facilitator superfamily (MFS) profile domain-containing protein n=1 Tax=Parthenolecanium corni TaxID=536013 RepID=A0AAN9TU53_9HEMI
MLKAELCLTWSVDFNSEVCLGTLIAGCVNGWSAPALVKLQSGDHIFNITSDQGSALALYSEIGHFFVPIPCGILADVFGRKPLFLMTSVAALIGWGIISFGQTYLHYVIARIILGFEFGSQCVLMTIYIAEISGKDVRGMFGSTSMFFLNVGVLFQFVIGSVFSISTTAVITFALCILQIVLALFLVESPYFLVAAKQNEKAENNLMWLRAATSPAISDEFSSITQRVDVRENLFVSVKNLLSKTQYKGFVYCMIISFLGELTGRVTVITYASENFKTADPSSAKLMTVLLGICNVVFPVMPIFLSDTVGRKIVIVISSIVAVSMHLISGLIYFLYLKMGVQLPWFQWLVFASIAGFQSSCSIYITNVLTLRGELIAENSRGFASGFSSMAFALAVFLATKTFQIVRDCFGIYWGFWLLGSYTTLLGLFTWIFIPETKNRSFEDIQRRMYGDQLNEKVKENSKLP